MFKTSRLSLFAFMGVVGLAAAVAAASRADAPAEAPRYTADGRLELPSNYRSWVYLSTGMDMAYTEAPNMSGMHMLDNVFVNREAYDVFQKTGTWPDKTVMVLEARRAVQDGSINKRGHFQAEVMGVEVHVKDEARFKGGWAFFGFNSDKPAQMVPYQAACYACHQAHGAVDTTFVQFYPTLLPKAQAMKTLSPGYQKDEVEAKR